MSKVPLKTNTRPSSWTTISVRTSGDGYSVYEAEERFWRERIAENVLRLSGVFLILAGYLQWFIPSNAYQGDAVLAKMALSVLFMGTGIALYLFASRGFRKVLRVDLDNRRIAMARVNTKNRSLVKRHMPMAEVESLFVKRAGDRHELATLTLRPKGSGECHAVLKGAQDELEELHGMLCADVHKALEPSPRRVTREAGGRTPVTRPRRVKPSDRVAALH